MIIEVIVPSPIVEVYQSGTQGPAGAGIPTGGLLGEVLVKASGADYDFLWAPIAGGSGIWGTIAGNIEDQTDLFDILEDKRDIDFYMDLVPNGVGGSFNVFNNSIHIRPTQASPNDQYVANYTQILIDEGNTGFDIGTGGNLGWMYNMDYYHGGKSNIGTLNYVRGGFTLGNGNDPIDVKGILGYHLTGQLEAEVTMSGQIQGFGFQISAHADADLANSTNVFFDFSNIACEAFGYNVFSANTTIGKIKNNSNYVAYNANPTIPEFLGNAGFFGFAINGNLGTFGTGGFNGISINPTVVSAPFANGIYVNMNNVNAVNKYAMYLEGNAQINGSLQFSGALSIGRLNAFGTLTPTDGGGLPSTVNSLISQVTTTPNVATNNFDTIGLNTSMLFTASMGSTNTSGAFGLGAASLALPMVVETHTGSFTDFLAGAVFAINLVGSSTGGTIGQIYGGRSVLIPNGITTVDRAYGWFTHAPFGLVGTDSWGIYAEDFPENYLEGNLKLGGVDKTSNASIGFELESTTKVILLSRLTTAQEGALTVIDGTIHYNSDTGKFRGRASGAWVDLN